MRKALEDELFRRHPKILNGTLIGHKISCGDGWFNLLDHLCTDIDDHKNSCPDSPQVQAFEIKSVNAGLRFYATGCDKYTSTAINQAEERSYALCEECGDKGDRNYKKDGIKCLCSLHRAIDQNL
jgi:hypothetical protein